MTKPIIAIDIDDVLGSQVQVIIAFSNEKYGMDLTPEDFKKEGPYWGYWEQVWGVDDTEGKKRIEEFIRAGHILNQPIMTGALDVIHRLKENYELVVVTARSDMYIEDTHKWLARHFPNVFTDVRFVPVWDKSKQVTKAMICKEIGADYLIDDNLEHCNLAAEEGITAVLFGEYGWNVNKDISPSIVRVKDWAAVGEYFREKS
jgi:5'(3')-deoxyribonucleotidase